MHIESTAYIPEYFSTILVCQDNDAESPAVKKLITTTQQYKLCRSMCANTSRSKPSNYEHKVRQPLEIEKMQFVATYVRQVK